MRSSNLTVGAVVNAPNLRVSASPGATTARTSPSGKPSGTTSPSCSSRPALAATSCAFSSSSLRRSGPAKSFYATRPTRRGGRTGPSITPGSGASWRHSTGSSGRGSTGWTPGTSPLSRRRRGGETGVQEWVGPVRKAFELTEWPPISVRDVATLPCERIVENGASILISEHDGRFGMMIKDEFAKFLRREGCVISPFALELCGTHGFVSPPLRS